MKERERVNMNDPSDSDGDEGLGLVRQPPYSCMTRMLLMRALHLAVKPLLCLNSLCELNQAHSGSSLKT